MNYALQITTLADSLNATFTVEQLREQWVVYAKKWECLTHFCKELAYSHGLNQPTTGGEWVSLAHFWAEQNDQVAMEREKDSCLGWGGEEYDHDKGEWVQHWGSTKV
jgi:hypothetical protein